MIGGWNEDRALEEIAHDDEEAFENDDEEDDEYEKEKDPVGGKDRELIGEVPFICNNCAEMQFFSMQCTKFSAVRRWM